MSFILPNFIFRLQFLHGLNWYPNISVFFLKGLYRISLYWKLSPQVFISHFSSTVTLKPTLTTLPLTQIILFAMAIAHGERPRADGAPAKGEDFLAAILLRAVPAGCCHMTTPSAASR